MARIPITRPALVGAFATRPRLLGAILVGFAASLALTYFTPLRTTTAVALGWDLMCLVFVVMMTLYMKDRDPEAMRTHAAEADEGRAVVLVLVLLASAVSIAAVAMELSAAKADQGLIRVAYVTLAFATVAASWFLVQLIFALHYAHDYYGRDDDDGPSDAGGLLFPGGEAPDYWDFLHFSIVIGVACSDGRHRLHRQRACAGWAPSTACSPSPSTR